MNKNENLNKAKEAKNDEFYTLYEDIEKELANYPVEQFENKTVLCPCDDYEWSNFTKYFIDNFERLKLKKLISTCIALDKPSVFDLINGDYEENQLKGKLFIKTKDKEERKFLNSDGDFRNKEIKKLKEESDIIITNPPFSLFRDFFNWIKDKKFLVICSINAIKYSNIFPYIKENKVWIGKGFGGGKFINSDKMVAICWLTNLNHTYKRKPLKLNTMEENIKKGIKYLKYDNYDAINVDRTIDIPSDYTRVMGVPISFLNKYCPEQFEIITYDNNPSINNKIIYKRIFVKLK